jgi:hypothetical protein
MTISSDVNFGTFIFNPILKPEPNICNLLSQVHSYIPVDCM